MATTGGTDSIVPRFHPVRSDVMAHVHTRYCLHGERTTLLMQTR